MPDHRIAVVGAGIAGMAAAYELARTPGVAVTLFEATARLGGTVETLSLPSKSGNPFIIETGPDSWVSDKPAARELAIELGLEHELIHSNDHARRNYLARPGLSPARGELTPMPDGMRMMVPTRWAPILESPLFSWQARLAYLREPKRAEELKQHALTRGEDADESVATFVRRHFGDEATQTIAGPLVAGVFGGDIETLSAAAVLAPFVRMEREHGSLIAAVMQRAARRQSEQGLPEAIFTTLRSGLQTLIDRMAATLPPAGIERNTRVAAMIRQTNRVGWRLMLVSSSAGAPSPGAESRGEQFDAVILATPAHVTRDLLAPLDPRAAALLEIEATSAIVVALAWEAGAAAGLRIPRGFGFLVPPGGTQSDVPTLLAGTFMHQKFPHRAPPGAVFLRGFFGGHAAPHMLTWSDDAIADAARREFARFLGPLPLPSHVIVRRWPCSLPQYSVGHRNRMRELAAHVEALPNFALTGNAYDGVGLPNLVSHGRSTARKLASRLHAESTAANSLSP